MTDAEYTKLVHQIADALNGEVTTAPHMQNTNFVQIATHMFPVTIYHHVSRKKLAISMSIPTYKNLEGRSEQVTFDRVQTEDERSGKVACVYRFECSAEKSVQKIVNDICKNLYQHGKSIYDRTVAFAQEREQDAKDQRATIEDLAQHFGITVDEHRPDHMWVGGEVLIVQQADSVRFDNCFNCTPETAKKIIALLQNDAKRKI